MKEKIAVWISQMHGIPYRFRKSLIKRTCPKILMDYPFEIDFYGIKYKGNTKDGNDKLFFMFGGCEKYMLSFMKSYYMAAKRDKFVFVDVGAHVGNHSLFMSKYASEIHAFEPNSRVRESMNSNIYLNNITNIIVHPIGLGNKNERIPFYVSEDDQLSVGSFCNYADNGSVYSEDLDIRVGDDVLAEKGVEYVDIIKVDVVGYEREVIEGLGKTIENARPLIIVEISDATRNSFGSRDDFESVFPKDYCFYRFAGVSRERANYKMVPFNYEVQKERVEVVAVPREKRIYLGNKLVKK